MGSTPKEIIKGKKGERLLNLKKHFDHEVVARARKKARKLYLYSEQKTQYEATGDFSFSEVIGGEDRLGLNRELRNLCECSEKSSLIF